MITLTDAAPETVEIDGRSRFIDTDFRTWIRISEIMSDRHIEPTQRLLKALPLCYPAGVPKNGAEALRQMLAFFKCESVCETASDTGGGTDAGRERGRAIYSFKYDAPYIIAAFWQQYGIDLTSAKLHWWLFRALFDALGDDTRFMKILGYRTVDTSDIKDKKRKRHYSKLKRIYALPDDRTEEEKEADWGAAF